MTRVSRVALACVALLVVPVTAQANEVVVLSAEPSTWAVANAAGSSHEAVLPENEAASRVRIVRDGDR
jgi:hypothetical protein